LKDEVSSSQFFPSANLARKGWLILGENHSLPTSLSYLHFLPDAYA